jgi:type III pantothenate kinase
MLLLIDAGNTRVKWAVMASARMATAELGHWSAYGSVLHDDLGHMADALKGVEIARVVIANVAGQSMREALECLVLRVTGLKPVPITWFASQLALAGIKNTYRNPAQLGCDRFAAMIGAHALFPEQALMIATCGTATTIDAVSAGGCFSGGMILPGLATMATSLAKNTAQLPQLPQAPQYNVALQPFADNTNDAIVSGCIAAQVGAIERALAAQAALLEDAAVAPQCILSGGAAGMIAPHLSVPAKTVDNLVLIGLQAALAVNSSC